MFDIGWQELFVVAVLALIVIGPKDLPKTIKLVTSWIRKARMMAREFQTGIDDMVREADLADVKKTLMDGSDDLKKELEQTVGTDIAKDLDLSEDETRKITSGSAKGVDLGEILEPSDEVPIPDGAVDDDDDVMPVAKSSPKTEQTS
ncbi:Sec-independent protein translocase protein TatB [Magnetovibrio blakemorei]|uniref:Sec-independent protein translocase protein TatB n=1 Tax=Magnetovibrio blakemorei TaxID=28181 RepID=A0A1E5Q609_9PROT|nr:Sec-independent protein translocase protein TatB [Magnetovibrio blakemorei]OEJ65945.1 twin arginine-targeting protein translocase TatB [Magnetovibrio blakemorei]